MPLSGRAMDHAKPALVVASAWKPSDVRSFAVPASAVTVVFETLLARYILKERVDIKRWIGAGLVACGVWLLAA